MKRRPRLFPFLCALLLPLVASAQTAVPVAKPTRPIPEVEHVLLISVDGLRPDKLLQADMPTVRALMKDGAYTFWARTTAMAITLPSHTSMVTGVTPAKHGIYWNSDLPLRRPIYPSQPTVMEMATKAGYSTMMVSGKSKFVTLNKPGTITYAWTPPGTDVILNNAAVLEHALPIIETNKPDFMFVHFPDCDTAGHAKGWGSPEYLAAVEKTDTALAAVFAALDRAKIRESTVIILTTDHGGQGLVHGPDDERSRNIPWLISGPGVRKNFDLTSIGSLVVHTEDTCATACWLLGLRLQPYFDGVSVDAAFVRK